MGIAKRPLILVGLIAIVVLALVIAAMDILHAFSSKLDVIVPINGEDRELLVKIYRPVPTFNKSLISATDLSDGSTAWFRFSDPFVNTVDFLTSKNGVYYFYIKKNNRIYSLSAISLKTGKTKWNYDFDVSFIPSLKKKMFISEDSIICYIDDDTSNKRILNLIAIDANSGKNQWQLRLDKIAHYTGSYSEVMNKNLLMIKHHSAFTKVDLNSGSIIEFEDTVKKKLRHGVFLGQWNSQTLFLDQSTFGLYAFNMITDDFVPLKIHKKPVILIDESHYRSISVDIMGLYQDTMVIAYSDQSKKEYIIRSVPLTSEYNGFKLRLQANTKVAYSKSILFQIDKNHTPYWYLKTRYLPLLLDKKEPNKKLRQYTFAVLDLQEGKIVRESQSIINHGAVNYDVFQFKGNYIFDVSVDFPNKSETGYYSFIFDGVEGKIKKMFKTKHQYFEPQHHYMQTNNKHLFGFSNSRSDQEPLIWATDLVGYQNRFTNIGFGAFENQNLELDQLMGNLL
ncbi:MAG: hypothetical protein MJE63_20910 [Proteobacteria bacterium]|nr:hypothetical protein [Pseudomonadota bacterium]